MRNLNILLTLILKSFLAEFLLEIAWKFKMEFVLAGGEKSNEFLGEFSEREMMKSDTYI